MEKKKNVKGKLIKYIVLSVFIAICLWISSYIYSTINIQLFIEELLEILKTVEGKIYGELIIYSRNTVYLLHIYNYISYKDAYKKEFYISHINKIL